MKHVTAALALASVAFHIWLIFSGLVPNLLSRPVHLIFALPFVFLFTKDRVKPLDALLCALGVSICLYIVWNRDALSDQYGSLEGWPQRIAAVALVLIVLEMARRAVKLALPIVACIALLYGIFGQYLPGEFGHPGIPFDSFFGTLVIAEGGLWGPLTGVSVNVVAVFIMLGAAVSAGEGGTAFMSIATRLAGRLQAGAAKVSVLSSALFGSISGSASANVASTGAITLPTMKRLGYPASLAGAVEATASTGGQIMPPLMGAGAFVMAELLRTNYTAIITAAFLPALLFFVAVWFGVDLFAKRYGLTPMAPEDIPSTKRVIRLSPFFVIPFGTLLIVLFATGRTPQFGAALAIFAAAGLLVIDENWHVSITRWGKRLLSASRAAAQQIAMVASIIICAGLIIGVLNMTGLGVKVTSVILSLSGGTLWGALALTAIACLILGMEVPTTAAYVICVSVAGPALQELGLPALQAHLFVFWYALLSTITPPVCGTVFIAAGMANTPWVPVAGKAMALGLGLYLVPIAFVVTPALVMPEANTALAAMAFAKVGAGLWLLAQGIVSSERSPLARILAGACGLGLILTPLTLLNA
ncbi:MAG: TRAP transporter permease [Hyphomicrobiales bacterium]